MKIHFNPFNQRDESKCAGVAEAGDDGVELMNNYRPAVGGVVVISRPRKKKRRFSKGGKKKQKLHDAFLRHQLETKRADLADLEDYAKRSDRSAKKKRDGVMRDREKNSSKCKKKGDKVRKKASRRLMRTIFKV